MIDIFFYTGSGYSLKAAKIIAQVLGQESRLKPIVGALRRGELQSDAETVGIVSPMHAFGLSSVCETFLKAARFPRANYVFALVTRGGAPIRLRGRMDTLMRKSGKKLDAFAYATTPNTFDVVSPFPTPPEVEEEKARFEEDVKAFARKVKDREHSIDEGYRNPLLENLVFPILRIITLSTGYFNLADSFFAGEGCTGCGACERLCPSGRVRMEGGKPRWDRKQSCQYCLACVQRCPSRAVSIHKVKYPAADRIPCPGITNDEIAAQRE